MNGDVRTVREALLAELVADVDRLYTRLDDVSPRLMEQSDRVVAAAQALHAASLTNSDAAKTSVGEFIARQTNDAVAKAKAELRATMDEAARAAYEETFAARMHELLARIESAGQQQAPRPAWLKLAPAVVAGPIPGAAVAALLVGR